MIFFVMAFAGCSDSDTISTSGGLATGNLVGGISGLVDSLGNMATDLSGVTVEAIGSGISAQTDSTGYWKLKNLPTRTYNLRFSKPGYVDYYVNGYSFLGGATSWFDQYFYLIMPPSFTVKFDGLFFTVNDKYLRGTLYMHCSENTPHFESVRMFVVFGSSKVMDLNDNSTFLTYINFNVINGSITRDEQTKSLTIENYAIGDTNLFHHGQTVYCQLFPYISNNQYLDIDKNKIVYVGQGAGSNILSQRVP